MAEDEDLEVLRVLVAAMLASADDESNEGADNEVEEGPHRPIVPGRSERESGFPTPTAGSGRHLVAVAAHYVCQWVAFGPNRGRRALVNWCSLTAPPCGTPGRSHRRSSAELATRPAALRPKRDRGPDRGPTARCGTCA